MKLYTRRGDTGGTDLFGGQRVDKDALRVEAYGSVDEFNSVLGMAHAACDDSAMREVLADLQSRLFEIGADLATPPSDAETPAQRMAPRISQAHIDELEHRIDAFCEGVPELKTFVLPGGCELAARLHFARTVCRRAERICVALARVEPMNDRLVPYLNRLSDLLFAMARKANHLAGIADVPWISPKRGK